MKYLGEKWKFDNNIKVMFGMSKIVDADFRNNDNEFYLESVLAIWLIVKGFDSYVMNSITKKMKINYEPTKRCIANEVLKKISNRIIN